jgi:hypothetical protein
VVADSEHARGDLIARFGIPPAQVTTIMLGVPSAFLVPSPEGAVAALRACARSTGSGNG